MKTVAWRGNNERGEGGLVRRGRSVVRVGFRTGATAREHARGPPATMPRLHRVASAGYGEASPLARRRLDAPA